MAEIPGGIVCITHHLVELGSAESKKNERLVQNCFRLLRSALWGKLAVKANQHAASASFWTKFSSNQIFSRWFLLWQLVTAVESGI